MERRLNTPKVSLIVPVYNMGQFLQRTIDSFLMQSEQDFELIICDNNSTDSTREIVASYRDRRIRYFCNASNIGFINNFNVGIKNARGKYISLISCDEFMVSVDSLKKRIDLLESEKEIDLVWCDYNLETYKLKTSDGKLVYWKKINPPKQIMTSAEAIMSVFKDRYATNHRITTVIFRRQILEASNFIMPLVHSADKPIILEWMIRSRNVAYVNEILHCSFMHESHQHDFFGKKLPYIGERDYLTIGFLDNHGPRITAMGLSVKALEVLALRNMFVTLIKISKFSYENFTFYGCFFLQRLLRLLISYLISLALLILFFPFSKIFQAQAKLRTFAGSISWVRKLYRLLFKMGDE